MSAEPIAIWPMGSRTYAAEVKIGGTPLSQSQQVGLQFDTLSGTQALPIPLPYDPVSLNGTNFVDLLVAMPTFGSQDFQFSFFFYIENTYAMIMHYATVLPTPSGITELKLWVANGLINVSKKYYNGNIDTGIPATQAISSNTWYHIGVTVTKSTGDVRVYLDTDLIVSLTSSTSGLNLDIPGRLRLASSFTDSRRNVRGFLTCVLAYDQHDTGDVSTKLGYCANDAAWQPVNSKYEACHI